MAVNKIPRLSSSELEIMEMLWEHGPVTLSEGHEALGLPIGYTTVQTRLNRLCAKKVVKKSKERPSQYEAAISKEQVNKGDLETLVNQVNGGSAFPLIAHLFRKQRLSKNEINEIKKMISDAEKNMK